jgi:hypothetical protein
VSGNWSVRWEAVAGSGGTPITYHAGYVDANTHAIPMVLPVTYSAGSGPFSGTTVIDTTKLTERRAQAPPPGRLDRGCGDQLGPPANPVRRGER